MVHGYCSRCRRVKRVRLTPSVAAHLAAGGVAQGVCADCDQPKPRETNPALTRINEARRGRLW